MASFEITEISVCLVCMHLMCNGEYNDGTDAAEKCAERQDLVWGGNQKYFTPGSPCECANGIENGLCGKEWCRHCVELGLEADGMGTHECAEFEQGFSWSSCDGCEDTNGGDRFLAYVMIPK